MTTRVEGVEVRCKLCGMKTLKRFNYRHIFRNNEQLTSREADQEAQRRARAFASEHARTEHDLDIDRVPYESKVHPHRLPDADIFIQQYGRQVA